MEAWQLVVGDRFERKSVEHKVVAVSLEPDSDLIRLTTFATLPDGSVRYMDLELRARLVVSPIEAG